MDQDLALVVHALITRPMNNAVDMAVSIDELQQSWPNLSNEDNRQLEAIKCAVLKPRPSSFTKAYEKQVGKDK